MSDVIVVGGGVIGLSLAWELAGRGVSVTLLDQGQVGQEASWAGAGMLPPASLSHAKAGEPALRALSHELWPEWSRELLELTGIDNEFRNCGAVEVSFDGALETQRASWCEAGTVVKRMTVESRRHDTPALSDEIAHSFHLPEFCQVRNPRHLKALVAGCRLRGVRILEGQLVTGWRAEMGKVLSVVTSTGQHSADQFVVAAGAWSRTILQSVGCHTDIQPVRGQIVLLKTKALDFDYVVELGPRYLVPRVDGRVVVGSTEEQVGFVKRNTAAGVRGLLDLATRLVPSLADAEFERCWSGLRPSSVRGVPFIGKVPTTDNVYVSAGHFRNGLQMSPGSSRLLADILLGHSPRISIKPFAVNQQGSEVVV